jgi:hypothetical protein
MSAAQGFVVPAGGGKHFASPTPGRSFALKLLGRDPNESIMMLIDDRPSLTLLNFYVSVSPFSIFSSTRESSVLQRAR